MKNDRPRDLTPEEIEELRKDAKEGHEWFQENFPKVIDAERIKAEAKEWVEKQTDYIRAGQYPPPRHDAELLSIEEMEARAKALREARTQREV